MVAPYPMQHEAFHGPMRLKVRHELCPAGDGTGLHLRQQLGMQGHARVHVHRPAASLALGRDFEKPVG